VIGDDNGSTEDERRRALPCDAHAVPGADVWHRAVTVAAPRPLVFRWLCQLRAAPYSWDLVDNLGRRSPPELTPGLDELAEGQLFQYVFRLRSWVRDEHLTMSLGRSPRRRARTWVTYQLDDTEGGTRLLVRIVTGAARPLRRPFAVGDLVMMRKQLRTLKEYAERDARRDRA
jgi:hypothetical protein